MTSEPDRWTFLDGDLVHPAKGREMPGDAFYFPSVSEHPSITGSGAVIGTKTYVRFINAHTYFLNAGIRWAPTSSISLRINILPRTRSPARASI